jgi:hypothetical protein
MVVVPQQWRRVLVLQGLRLGRLVLLRHCWGRLMLGADEAAITQAACVVATAAAAVSAVDGLAFSCTLHCQYLAVHHAAVQLLNCVRHHVRTGKDDKGVSLRQTAATRQAQSHKHTDTVDTRTISNICNGVCPGTDQLPHGHPSSMHGYCGVHAAQVLQQHHARVLQAGDTVIRCASIICIP